MPKYYGGIGSRQTPEHILSLMQALATRLERDEYYSHREDFMSSIKYSLVSLLDQIEDLARVAKPGRPTVARDILKQIQEENREKKDILPAYIIQEEKHKQQQERERIYLPQE